MNVSSVKNLNGETFSAVQDADLTTVVQSNSGNWNDISAYQNASGTYMPSGQFISARGLDQIIRGSSTTANFIGFKFPETYQDTPAVYLNGQFGSAYYKENELKLNRSNMTIAFNIGGGGPKISAGGTGTTAPSYMYLYNSGNSATLSQTGMLLSANDTTSGMVNIPSISAWNDTTDVVQANSATWAQGGNPEVENYVQTNSGTIDETITAYQNASSTYLTAVDLSPYATTAEVDTLSSMFSGAIDYVSANAGGGGSTSGLVSGTNFVKVPDWEGSTDGEYWSACISGDVKVAHGFYIEESEFHQDEVYSLSAIGSDIGNKLNKNTIENSKTIRSINNRPYEVYDVAYKRTNLTNGSAHRIDLDDDADISYIADDVVDNSNLYSASITAETTATGSIDSDGGIWRLVDFSNGSAILTATYPAGIRDCHVSLYTWEGWGPITNCEATCTVYTSAELTQLAYKDDIPKINFVSTSSEATGTNILYVVTGAGA